MAISTSNTILISPPTSNTILISPPTGGISTFNQIVVNTSSNTILLANPPIQVNQGGTGVFSWTPNQVIASGSTSIAPLVSINSDTVGWVLTATGPNTPPTFQAASGVYSIIAGTGITISGTSAITVSLSTPVSIANGGTGQTTASAALTALLPTQAGVTSGWGLTTNGASASWTAPAGGTVTNVSNSDGSLTISPTTGAVVAGINFFGSYTWYSQQTFSNTMLAIGIHATGAFNTTIATGGGSTDGVSLISAVAATSGAPQQYSPRLRFTGYGWKTNTTAGSQEVDFIIENQPQQGTTAPSGNLVFSSQINAGGYTPVFTLTSAGTITTGTWNGTTIAIANGGTGQTTANTAFNALAPSQTGNAGFYLTTSGSTTSWVATTYTFTQLTPISVWTITHNLGKMPSVTVVDSANTIVVGEVVYLNTNSVQVTFSSSFGGMAYLN